MAIKGQTVPNCQQLANQAAMYYGLPPSLLYQLLLHESSCTSNLTSPTGNKGVAQLGDDFIHDNCRGADPFKPEQAIPCAAAGLAKLFNQFGSYALALAAYHAGAGNVKKYAPCVPPTKDKAFGNTTLSYVKEILAKAGLPFDTECPNQGQGTQPGNTGVVRPAPLPGAMPTTQPSIPVTPIGGEFRTYLILGVALLLIIAAISRYR